MTAIQLLTRRYITNEKGKIEYDSGEIPSKSFVFAFMQGLLSCFRRDSGLNAIPITGGAAVSVAAFGISDIEIFRCDEIIAGTGVVNIGTVIGSGTVAVATTDHVISSLIPHGTAAGQAEYFAQSISAVQIHADRLDIILSRNFRNSHTLDLIVRECGHYVRGHRTGAPHHHMIIRDLITPAITLPPARILTIEYIIRAPL